MGALVSRSRICPDPVLGVEAGLGSGQCPPAPPPRGPHGVGLRPKQELPVSGQHVDAQPALSLHCAQVHTELVHTWFSSKRFQLNVFSTCSGQFLTQANLKRLQPSQTRPGLLGLCQGGSPPRRGHRQGPWCPGFPGWLMTDASGV